MSWRIFSKKARWIRNFDEVPFFSVRSSKNVSNRNLKISKLNNFHQSCGGLFFWIFRISLESRSVRDLVCLLYRVLREIIVFEFTENYEKKKSNLLHRDWKRQWIISIITLIFWHLIVNIPFKKKIVPVKIIYYTSNPSFSCTNHQKNPDWTER